MLLFLWILLLIQDVAYLMVQCGFGEGAFPFYTRSNYS